MIQMEINTFILYNNIWTPFILITRYFILFILYSFSNSRDFIDIIILKIIKGPMKNSIE